MRPRRFQAGDRGMSGISQKTVAIIGTGIALAVLIVPSLRELRRGMDDCGNGSRGSKAVRRVLLALRRASRINAPWHPFPDEDCTVIDTSATGHRAHPSMPSSTPANTPARAAS